MYGEGVKYKGICLLLYRKKIRGLTCSFTIGDVTRRPHRVNKRVGRDLDFGLAALLFSLTFSTYNTELVSHPPHLPIPQIYDLFLSKKSTKTKIKMNNQKTKKTKKCQNETKQA